MTIEEESVLQNREQQDGHILAYIHQHLLTTLSHESRAIQPQQLKASQERTKE